MFRMATERGIAKKLAVFLIIITVKPVLKITLVFTDIGSQQGMQATYAWSEHNSSDTYKRRNSYQLLVYCILEQFIVQENRDFSQNLNIDQLIVYIQITGLHVNVL